MRWPKSVRRPSSKRSTGWLPEHSGHGVRAQGSLGPSAPAAAGSQPVEGQEQDGVGNESGDPKGNQAWRQQSRRQQEEAEEVTERGMGEHHSEVAARGD
jgi:hypothetical protein